MKTPKFFELIGSSKGDSSDPRFRVFVELADKRQRLWEAQALGTTEGRAQMTHLRTGLLESPGPSGRFRTSFAPVDGSEGRTVLRDVFAAMIA